MCPKKWDRLSVIIIARDEERNIGPCLDSVLWADEVVVVDAFSQDRTVAVCQEKGVRVFRREWDGFVRQKRFALERAKGPWVLSLDADERVTEGLKQEILSILLSGDATCDGYAIPRRSYFLGKWIKHGGWYPGYQLRLFRKTKVRLPESRVHEGFVVDGRIGHLREDILHNTYPTMGHMLEKIHRYSTWLALDRLEREEKRIRWFDFFIHPVGAFLRKYVSLLGFLDGIHGLILALMDGMGKLALYTTMWDFQNAKRKDETLRLFYDEECCLSEDRVG